MVDTVVTGTLTTRLSMSGTDTLTVEAGGILTVSANAQAVRFNGTTTNGIVFNSGTIENTAAGGRAIRIENSAGTSPVVFVNNYASGIIRSDDDAFQIQAGIVTGGSVTFNNIGGQISSTVGQALDFAGGTGAATQSILNAAGGSITALANDAIRIGGVGTINNYATINGGSAAGYTVSADGIQFEDNSSGTVFNYASISGDRHGINGGLNTVVSVTNDLGDTITGRNGSGVGLDGSGSVTNYGTISGNFSDSAGSDTNGSTIGQPNGGGPDGVNDCDGDGIDIDGEATIINFGTIEGNGAGGTGSDGRSNTAEGIAAGGGTITNNAGAIIRGAGLGILIDDSSTGPAPFVTEITNDGTISGMTSVAIRIIGNQNDTVDNAGTISGGGGTAMLLGEGNDTLKIRNGSAITGISDGEGGTDTLDYSAYAMAGITVILVAETATGTGGVLGFENVIGSAQNDTMTGNSSVNSLVGNGGNDTLVAFAGEFGSGETYDGGADEDALQLIGNGVFDFTGVTISNIERVDFIGAGGFVFFQSGYPALSVLDGLFAAGVTDVSWTEGGASNDATRISGGPNDGGTQVIATDAGGNTWTSSTHIFGADDVLVSKDTTNDDGTHTIWSYDAGVLASVATTGLAGIRDTVTIAYDAAGRWDSNTTSYDGDAVRSTVLNYDDAQRVDSRVETASNGFVATTNFNDVNQRTSIISDDSVSNIHAWESSTLTLDPATGQVTQKVTLFDNGNTTTDSYLGGVIQSRVTTDGGANEAFTTVTQNYLAGVFTYQSNINDNGTGLIIGSAAGTTISQNNAINNAIFGNGGSDVFTFNAGMGQDRIFDFTNGVDRLNLLAFNVTTEAQLEGVASITQAGADLLIDFAGADSLTLKNFLLANLDDGDFLAA